MQMAAIAGYPFASDYLAHSCYEYNKILHSRVTMLYKMAHNDGSLLALFSLAKCALSGYGMAVNDVLSLKLLERCVNKSGYVEAIKLLVKYYICGVGVKQTNLDLAADLIKLLKTAECKCDDLEAQLVSARKFYTQKEENNKWLQSFPLNDVLKNKSISDEKASQLKNLLEEYPKLAAANLRECINDGSKMVDLIKAQEQWHDSFSKIYAFTFARYLIFGLQKENPDAIEVFNAIKKAVNEPNKK
jgi:hypothetical protein